MIRPLTDAELDALDRAAAMGFHREPAPRVLPAGDGPPDLTLVAFAAHQRRLGWTAPRRPAALTAWEAPVDPRPMVPERARPGLRRLARAAALRRTPALLVPVARAIRAHGWRLHPLDADVMAALGVAAGPYERWLAKVAGLRIAAAAAAAPVGDDAWTGLPLTDRVGWLARRRYADPDAARALLEATWPAEKADARGKLLGALEVRLGAADVPFLSGLAADRSPQVKVLAKGLLARAEAVPPDPREVVELAFKVKRGAVSLVDGVDAPALVHTLAGLGIDDALGWLGVDDAALIAAAPALRDVLPGFALAAARVDGDRAAALLGAALAAGHDPNEGPLAEALGPVPRDVRRALLIACWDSLRPHVLGDDVEVWLTLLDGPLTLEASVATRADPRWLGALDRLADEKQAADADAALTTWAALVPPEDAAAAAAQLGARGPMAAPLVRQLWQWLAELEGAP